MPKKKKQKTANFSSTEQKQVSLEDGPLYRSPATTTTTTTTKGSQTRLLDSHPDLLSDLLSPGISSTEFLTRFFRRQAVHVPSTTQGVHRVERIQKQMLDLNVQKIFEKTASENIFVWLQQAMDHSSSTANGGKGGDKKINSIEVPDPETAFALYQAGHATYCRAPSHVEELLVGALLENTGLGCGQYDASGQSMTSLGRGEVETFISTKAGSVTGWHTDFQENFTIQLSGRKKWSLQRGTVVNVLRGVTPHYSVSAIEGQVKAGRLDQNEFAFGPPAVGKNATGPVDEVILEPGDVLYFPAGMWHKIEVLEPGISINCSLMATNYATLVCQSLQHILLQRPEWRASVCRPSDGSTVTETVDNLLEKLPGVIRDWTRQGAAAQGMLPPVLQHGEVVAPGENDESWEELEEDDGDSEEDEEVGKIAPRKDFGESSSMGSDSDEAVAGDEDAPTVNLDDEPPQNAEFDPSVSALQGKLKTHRLGRNPLALLIDEKDIVRHYQKNGNGSNGIHVYVLNVNYAGNEAHESFLRVRIQTDQAKLDKAPADEIAKRFLEKKPNLIGWLLYLGYLVWVPRKP